MMVRALDSDGDWTYGKGKNDYKRELLAVSQNIQTRLSSFLGDCFFAADAGIDWWNLLGGKDQRALQLAISACILNTQNVTGILQLSVSLDVNRLLTVSYRVQTTYSITIQNEFEYDLGVS